MRLLVTANEGIRYGGRTYQKGEEIELPEDRNGNVLGRVLIAKRRARRAEPVIVGNPPPPPQAPAPIAEPSPEPAPPPEPEQQSWMAPPWAEEKSEEPSAESTPEETEEDSQEGQAEGDAPRRRGRPPIHGRYSRRDLRSEE